MKLWSWWAKFTCPSKNVEMFYLLEGHFYLSFFTDKSFWLTNSLRVTLHMFEIIKVMDVYTECAFL